MSFLQICIFTYSIKLSIGISVSGCGEHIIRTRFAQTICDAIVNEFENKQTNDDLTRKCENENAIDTLSMTQTIEKCMRDWCVYFFILIN
jgi:hypothetical protein